MKTKIWEIKTSQLEDETTKEVFDEIKMAILKGEVIGLPTETVFGLAGDATNQTAVNKIFKAKNRPADNPLIVHIYDKKQLELFISHVDDKVKKLMEHFWPGPISFILPYKGEYLAQSTVAYLNSVAVRMPMHPVGLKVLEHVGVPLAAPSANLSGKPSPTNYTHVIDDLDGRVYGVINSESASHGLESTVLDCTKYPYRIVRPGTITKSELEQVLKDSIQINNTVEEKPISPGQKYKHYAPSQPLKVVEQGMDFTTTFNEGDKKIGVIAPETMRHLIPKEVVFLSLCTSELHYKEAARNLYAALRKMDRSDVDIIYIHGFPINEHTQALMNRIYRAAGKNGIEV